jgi:hypothetical protein
VQQVRAHLELAIVISRALVAQQGQLPVVPLVVQEVPVRAQPALVQRQAPVQKTLVQRLGSDSRGNLLVQVVVESRRLRRLVGRVLRRLVRLPLKHPGL